MNRRPDDMPENDKPTFEQVRAKLEAIQSPDVNADELLTLISEPLAHIAFKCEATDGGMIVKVWTPQCVFALDTRTLRVGVCAAETLVLAQARKIVAESGALETTPQGRARRRKAVKAKFAGATPKEAAPEITETLSEDKAKEPAEDQDDDDSEPVEEVVTTP